MNLEARLRRHFADEAGRLPTPPDRIQDVQRRGRRRRFVERAAVAVVVVAALVALPVAFGLFGTRLVIVSPGPSPSEPATTPTGGPSPEPGDGDVARAERERAATERAAAEAERVEREREAQERRESSPGGEPPAIGVADLLAPALVHERAAGGRLVLQERADVTELWPEPVQVALPDRRGGVVLQPVDEGAVWWLPHDGGEAVRLVTAGGPAGAGAAEGELHLRALLPDGRVLYSLRPPEPLAEGEDEDEEFFAVALEPGAQPQLVAASGAYEDWTGGPAVAAGEQVVFAGCHNHCSLWRGMPGEPEADQALYHGGGHEQGPSAAIEGLAATPDGRWLAFVEFDPAMPGAGDPELVLLDGASFDAVARIPLPRPGEEGPGGAVVSLSGDGQRVLVTLTSAPGWPRWEALSSYLVDGALTTDPVVHPVETDGVVRWADPVAASGAGGPVTAAEEAAAEALHAFAHAPSAAALTEVPLAERVHLGLGPDLVGDARSAEALADPAAWALGTSDELFRAHTGPFSALDLLAGVDEVRVVGGPHAHCAAPPVPAPAEVAGLRRVSMQPAESTSCLEWWTVDLFLTAGGDVAAVTLDIWEP